MSRNGLICLSAFVCSAHAFVCSAHIIGPTSHDVPAVDPCNKVYSALGKRSCDEYIF